MILASPASGDLIRGWTLNLSASSRLFLSKKMDCRVKPGNDDLSLAPMGSSPRMSNLCQHWRGRRCPAQRQQHGEESGKRQQIGCAREHQHNVEPERGCDDGYHGGADHREAAVDPPRPQKHVVLAQAGE